MLLSGLRIDAHFFTRRIDEDAAPTTCTIRRVSACAFARTPTLKIRTMAQMLQPMNSI